MFPLCTVSLQIKYFFSWFMSLMGTLWLLNSAVTSLKGLNLQIYVDGNKEIDILKHRFV